MSIWNFKTIRSGSKGAEFVELSAAQQARIKTIFRGVGTAVNSTVANPPFSNNFVKESIGMRMLDGCTLLPAGNIGVWTLPGLARGRIGSRRFFVPITAGIKVSEPILGIIAGSPGNIASPCGNCRDLLLDEFGEDFEIVSGAPKADWQSSPK